MFTYLKSIKLIMCYISFIYWIFTWLYITLIKVRILLLYVHHVPFYSYIYIYKEKRIPKKSPIYKSKDWVESLVWWKLFARPIYKSKDRDDALVWWKLFTRPIYQSKDRVESLVGWKLFTRPIYQSKDRVESLVWWKFTITVTI